MGKDREERMAAETLQCAVEELSQEVNYGVQNTNCVWECAGYGVKDDHYL